MAKSKAVQPNKLAVAVQPKKLVVQAAEGAKVNTLDAHGLEEESEDKAYSRMMTSPTVNAATTMHCFHPMKEATNVADLFDEIAKQVSAVQQGNFDRPEAILTAQAHALDTIFTTMARRAANNLQAGQVQAMETYLRLALKAQSQCRATLETLSEIKYPRNPTFIGQQNVAQQQQVNNGASFLGDSSRVRKKTITRSNELLEASRGKWLDTRTSCTAIESDQPLEPVGKIDRPEN